MNINIFKKFAKHFVNDGDKTSTSGNSFINNIELLYANSPLPVYLIDDNYNLLWANHRFSNSFQTELNKKCHSAIIKSQTICLNCPVIISSRKKFPFEKAVNIKDFDGKPLVQKVLCNPLQFEGKDFYLNFIIEEEISSLENKQSLNYTDFKEKNLNWFYELFEQFNIPVLLTDLNFVINFVNKAFLEFSRISKEVIGKNFFNICKFKNNLSIETLLARIINNEKISITNEIYFHGSQFANIVSIEFIPLTPTEQNKQILLLFHQYKDSSYQSVEEKEKLELLTKLFKKATLGIVALNDFGEIKFENEKATHFLKEFNDLFNEIIKNKEAILIQGNAKISISNHKESKSLLIEGFETKSNITKEHFNLFFIEDITKLEEAEKELNSLKQTLIKIEKNTKSILFKITPDYKISDVFGSFDEITGCKVEDFVEKERNWLELVHSEDYHKVKEYLAEMFHFTNLQKSFSYRLIKPNGEVVWVESFVENISDDRGKILFLETLTTDITERKEVEERLKASQEEMRNLAMYFESLREEEKKRLAFEIHDELGHILTAMKLELSWVLKKKFLREDVLHEKLHKMIDMIDLTIRKVRSISSQLRPSVLDHFGITAAIEWQAKEFQKQTAIRCRLFLPKQEIQLNESKSIVVFRVFQEILTNIARHANATRVDIHLDVDGNNLVLTVSDNGKGIKVEDISAKKSLGIIGMKERASSVNGKLTISGVSNIGTTVTLTIPIN